jgi:abhydrolase domain-containing protein 6
MLIGLVHRFVRARFRRIGMVSRFLDLGSCLLHYFEYNHPDPSGSVLLLHGLGTSASTWIHILPWLVKEYHVVAVDLPGFGFSRLSAGISSYSLSQHCAALSALVDRIGSETFTLVGHSFGGWIAIRLAAARPERVQRLLLVDTAGVSYPGAEELRRLFTVESTASMRRLLQALWYRYPWYLRPFAPALYHEMAKRQISSIVSSISEEDLLAQEFSLLTMPVNVVWGREDKVISPEVVAVIQRNVPRASVDFVDRCGHVPQLERPQELKRILRRILAEEHRGLD